MYHKILDEAYTELKENEFKELFQKEISAKSILPDCIIETVANPYSWAIYCQCFGTFKPLLQARQYQG